MLTGRLTSATTTTTRRSLAASRFRLRKHHHHHHDGRLFSLWRRCTVLCCWLFSCSSSTTKLLRTTTTTTALTVVPSRPPRHSASCVPSRPYSSSLTYHGMTASDDEAEVPRPRRGSRTRGEAAAKRKEKPAVTDKTARSQQDKDEAPAKKKKPKQRNDEKSEEKVPKTAKKSSTTIKGSPKKTRTPTGKKRSASETTTVATGNTASTDDDEPVKKKKAPAHQVLTERDVLPKLWNADEHGESYTFKIGTWNVAGLRGLMKKDPDAIANLIQRLNLDVLCLQETKLQESHLNDTKVTLPEIPGYEAHYSCCTVKKGYAGTAAFIRQRGNNEKASKQQQRQQTSMDAFVKPAAATKKKDSAAIEANETLPVNVEYLQPEQVSLQMGNKAHDQEGRVIVMDFPLFTAVNLYVPNSGQQLVRLDYRTKEWDKDLLAFMQSKKKERGVPVLWLGDLNVAHTHLEVWNDGAKHLAKQAGVTAEERESFQAQLDAGFIDAFRKLHPDAKGHYSYWSQRAGNREPNKGLRLDYFVCDPQFFNPEESQVVVRDSYMVKDQLGSDHCPAVLEIEIKKE